MFITQIHLHNYQLNALSMNHLQEIASNSVKRNDILQKLSFGAAKFVIYADQVLRDGIRFHIKHSHHIH